MGKDFEKLVHIKQEKSYKGVTLSLTVPLPIGADTSSAEIENFHIKVNEMQDNMLLRATCDDSPWDESPRDPIQKKEDLPADQVSVQNKENTLAELPSSTVKHISSEGESVTAEDILEIGSDSPIAEELPKGRTSTVAKKTTAKKTSSKKKTMKKKIVADAPPKVVALSDQDRTLKLSELFNNFNANLVKEIGQKGYDALDDDEFNRMYCEKFGIEEKYRGDLVDTREALSDAKLLEFLKGE